MDAYFTRRFCERLVPYLNKKLVSLLEDAGLDLVACLQMFAMERPFRRVRATLDNHLINVVTQNFKAIDGLYQCYSIPSLSSACEKRSRRKTLLTSVERIVKRRHAIAHGGDLNSRGKLVPVDLGRTKKRVNDVRTFVEIAETILDDRFAK